MSVWRRALLQIVAMAGLWIPAARAEIDPSNPPTVRIELASGQFRVVIGSVETLQGAALQGLVLATRGDLGTNLHIRIEGVQHASEAGVELYSLAYRRDDDLPWAPLCQPDQYGQRLGFPLLAEHAVADTPGPATGLRIVCTSGAYGKCVMRGYAPWRTTGSGESLLPIFAACVRMMRADYCGDGTSFTTPGRRVLAWDNAGIRTKPSDVDETHPIEASWNADGPMCLSHVRAPDTFPLAEVLQRCPSLRNKLHSNCHDLRGDKGRGALMWNQ